MVTKDPLENLFTNEKEVDVQLLADILSPYIKINSEDNVIFFTEPGSTLSIQQRLLLFLLARKVLKLKNKVETEGISPTELISETQLKEGSVHPSLKSLRGKGLVMTKKGKYFVPNHQLRNIKKSFTSKEKYGS